MYSKQKNRKAKAGLFLIASPRFKNLGEGLPHGTYGERKAMQVEEILGTLDFLDVIFPGIVYEREDAVRAMERFYLEKADFIIAEFLSWSEDFAWIRFLRDMPEVPMIFVNVAKERMAFRDTLDEDDFIEYLCSGTLVGSLEGSGSLPRVGRKHVRIVMDASGHSPQPPAYAACCGNRISDCWPITTRRCGPPISIPTRSSRKSVRRSISSPIRPTARSSTA